MALKVRQAQTSFHHGELSPLMAARYDKSFVTNGAESLLNFAPLAQGGARTRPGTEFLAVLGSTYGVAIPFVFSPDQAYVMHARSGALDVYSTTGSLLNTVTVSQLTSGMCTDGKLTWAHSYDTLVLCHEDLEPQIIKRTGSTTFTAADISFETGSTGSTGAESGYPVNMPFYKYAASTVTISASTINAGSTVTLTTSDSHFSTQMVNDIVRIAGKQLLITATTAATVATAIVKEALSSTNATDDWDEQAWSAYRGWPICPVFFPDRLVFGGAKSRPSGIWLSKIGEYFNFELASQEADDAIWEGIAGMRIKYVEAGRFLTIFGDREFAYVPTSASNPLTPANFSVVKQQPYGTAQVRPRLFDEAFLMIQNTNAVAREALWDDVSQQYIAPPISLLANHLVTGGSTYGAPTGLAVLYGQPGYPEQYAMLLTSSGQVSCFHSVREQKIAAWAPWQTSGTVKSITDVDTDVFMFVERAMDTGTVLAMERFCDTGEALDCQVYLNGSSSGIATFSGATHYAGETVHICSLGHYLGSATVSASGTVTLPDADLTTTGINVGKSFAQTVTPMPAHFDLPTGTSKGNILGLVRAHIQVDRSAGFSVSGQDVYLDFAGDAFSSAAPTETGLITVHFSGYDEDAQCTLNITNPAKVTVLGLTREVEVNG